MDTIVIVNQHGQPLLDLGPQGEESSRGKYSRSSLLEPFSQKTHDLPTMHQAVDHILAEILALDDPKVAKLQKLDSRGKPRFRDTLRLILFNLYAAWTTYDHGRREMPSQLRPYVAYSRDDHQYRTAKYKGLFLTRDNVVGAVDALRALGYIEHQNGYHDKATGEGKSSRMRATVKLILVLVGCGVKKHELQRDIEPVQLRRKEKRKHKDGKPYTVSVPMELGTARTGGMKTRIKAVNEMLACSNVELRLTVDKLQELVLKEKHYADLEEENKFDDTAPHGFNTGRCLLYRVFNDVKSLTKGGRWYGHWVQGLPKALRRNNLYIDGHKAIEVDYDAIHPTILYTHKNYAATVLPGGADDLYVLDGYNMERAKTIDGKPVTFRAVAKMAMLTLINATKESGAIRSLFDGKFVGGHHRSGLAKRFGLTRDETKALIEALKQKHELIREWFGRDVGKELQFIDSQIAEGVMLNLWKQGIHSLCVHDSFLVGAPHLVALQLAMTEESRQICGTPIAHKEQ